MGLITGIEKAIDKSIGIISPERAFKRNCFRKILTRTQQYAAAKTNRLTGDWTPVDGNVNDIISASSPQVRARVRQLVRDFPYFTRAVNKLTQYTVGPGILLQSRIKDPDEKLDKKAIQQVEDSFSFWADDADISRKLHYYELMELSKRQDVECGEFIIIKRKPRSKTYLPYALQMIEADWLTDINAKVSNRNNTIEQGIEFSTITGEVVAYHFEDPNSWGKPAKVKAENVIHGFQTLRPGQIRGISPFAPGVLVAQDLQDYMETEIDIAKMAAKYLAIIKTPDPISRIGPLPTNEKNQKIDELENAIIEYLNPGEEITIASNPRPGTNFPPFVKLILCMLSITTEVPYELLSGDYSGMNYSVGRTARNDFAHALRPISVRHVRHFAQKTFKPFMDIAVLSGKLSCPGYFSNPLPYLRCEWQPPGMESIDPLRESKAAIDQVKARLKSPQEIAKARGRDLEDIYKEIARAKEMAEELGISFEEEVSTALANNPAAVSDDDRSLMMDLIDKLDSSL
jgi:lambda family phage portal protein